MQETDKFLGSKISEPVFFIATIQLIKIAVNELIIADMVWQHSERIRTSRRRKHIDNRFKFTIKYN